MLDNLTARYPLTRLAWISIAAPWRRSRSKRWHGRPTLAIYPERQLGVIIMGKRHEL